MKEINWSIEKLFAPLTATDFLNDYWQRKNCYIARSDPSYFSKIVSTEIVDHLLAEHAGKPDLPLSVIGGRRNTPKKVRVNARPQSHWHYQNVLERFDRGGTIRIGHVARYLPAVREVSALLENFLSSDISVNLYLSPADAQAFSSHFDDHDVFVLQIEGEKTWQLYSPPSDLPIEVKYRGRQNWLKNPLPYESDQSVLPAIEESCEYRLKPGQLLYVPRGVVHRVFSTDLTSLHLTVAAPVLTWYEVLVHALMEAADQDNLLRQALPVGFAHNPAAKSTAADKTAEVVAALGKALTPGMLQNSLKMLGDRFIYSRELYTIGRLADVSVKASIRADNLMQIRPLLIYNTRKYVTEIYLLFSGNFQKIPIRAESMLTYILEQKRFRISDLPTHLSDESRLVFCHSLLINGFLEIVE